MKICCALMACALIPLGASAQRALPEVRVSGSDYRPPGEVLRAQTSLVALDVVVRRRDGSVITGLARDDFRIEDNGQPRAVAAFSTASRPAALAPTGATPAPSPPSPAPAAVAAVPRAIALYFDDVNTDKDALAQARNAAERFVREALRPGDRVAVFTASSQQSLDFTSDPARLRAVLAKLQPHPRYSAVGLGICPRITPYQAYLITNHIDPSALAAALAEKVACDKQAGIEIDDGTESYIKPIPGADNTSEQVLAQAETTWEMASAASYNTLAAARGVVEFLARQPGSRMLLLASGGFLAGDVTLEQQQDGIIQTALHAGVVINALDAKGLYTDGPGRPLDELPDLPELPLPTYFFEETSKLSQRQAEDAALANLAESTGGLFFHDNNDLSLGFQRLGMMPALTYQLAFAPGALPSDGKYHKLKVTLAAPAPGTIIQARPGYFDPAPATGTVSPEQAMAAALRSPESRAEVAATVVAAATPGQVTIAVRLDVARLPLHDEHGRRRQDLRFLVGLFGSNGNFQAGKQGEMDLALTAPTWKRLSAQGLSAKFTLQAPAGAYRLAVVVQESSDGKLFATSQPVRIP